MKVINKTNGAVLATEAGLARTTLARMKGLLCKDRLEMGEGLIITPCSAIHTIGMRFSIDVVFYDKSNRAVSVIQNMKPCRLSRWRPRARGVVELPAGTIAASPVQAGDELIFE